MLFLDAGYKMIKSEKEQEMVKEGDRTGGNKWDWKTTLVSFETRAYTSVNHAELRKATLMYAVLTCLGFIGPCRGWHCILLLFGCCCCVACMWGLNWGWFMGIKGCGGPWRWWWCCCCCCWWWCCCCCWWWCCWGWGCGWGCNGGCKGPYTRTERLFGFSFKAKNSWKAAPASQVLKTSVSGYKST